MSEPIDRRHFLGLATTAGLAAGLGDSTGEAGPDRPPTAPPRPPRPYLTEPADFYDVSRGNPKPYTLKGEALVKARLTPETWRLEIVADSFVEEPSVRVPASLERPRSIEAGDAVDPPPPF